MGKKPNVIVVFSDQHRADATGYRGNPDVRTPYMDRLAAESVDCTTAVAGIPVCCPSRACLITGQYPLTHGVFVNDVNLGNDAVSIGEAFKQGGYRTAYVGKWHLDGHGRSQFIPRERRQGFDYWRVLECTHDYNHSFYYGDQDKKLKWDGYDAAAQTQDVINYIRASQESEQPFLLMLSWGPPHNPYDTAPQAFRDMYDPAALTLRPNVPDEWSGMARTDLSGYYAHISALDHLLGQLLDVLEEEAIDNDTVFVYTSDHGDMLGSHGEVRKQKPWDESIRVPLLIRYPAMLGKAGKKIAAPINTPDLMPTLLGLCGLEIPGTVEGSNYSAVLQGVGPEPEAALLTCVHPFGEWHRGAGGREYRGIRTTRYTYICDLNGPWLLFDNETDPYQMNNLCSTESNRELQTSLHHLLTALLMKRGDEFLPGDHYLQEHGYITDETGTVPYTD
ncbi:sulfatase family protein [Paenibacillus mendelii]|uniref:Sulfatase n=1 Tax=Paenibacillus mendelii TaxID=206163 RepID=A0ABV6J5Z9_9BACL|nr:sulfatase [Paenibacillus mendelii]MCQ6560040.1 sulfatase [Paenibacillus mendelii]